MAWGSDYIVVLKVRDDQAGRARAKVKEIVARSMNDAADSHGWNEQDLYLQDITVTEVV